MTSAQNLAKQAAKQIAREPFEILKTAQEQVEGAETPQQPEGQSAASQEQNKRAEEQQKQADKLRSVRQVEALNRELTDIHKQDLFSDLQKKISEGAEVPLEDYPELSLEQKQVLNAEMKAVREQMENAKSANEKSFVEPAVKKGRQLFNFGKKTEMKREQTRVEKPVPPSG